MVTLTASTVDNIRRLTERVSIKLRSLPVAYNISSHTGNSKMTKIRPMNNALNISKINNSHHKAHAEMGCLSIPLNNEIKQTCFWKVIRTGSKNEDPLRDPQVKMKTLMSLVSLLGTTGASGDPVVQKKIAEVRGMLTDALSSGSTVTEAQYCQKMAELYSAIANSKHKASGSDNDPHRDEKDFIPSGISNRRLKEITEDIMSTHPARLLSDHIPGHITGILES